MKRQRILHLRASNFVGGPEHQLLRHADAQRDGAWEIALGTFVGAREGHEFCENAQRMGLLSLAFPTGLTDALRTLAQTIRQKQIKLLCTHGYKADVLGILARQLTQVPVACFLRGWTGENWKVRAYENVDRQAIRYADRIVCLSKLQAQRTSAQRSLSGKIRVVCNAIDIPQSDDNARIRARTAVRERLQLPFDCQIVATAGRLSPEKGLGDLLRAASKLQGDFPEVRFVVFGDGPMRGELQQQARSLGIVRRTIFAGFHADLRQLLPGIDLLVSPSHSEEMPNVVLEAMAAALPVVATEVGGLAEMAGAQHALRLVNPGEPENLADAVRELLLNPKSARKLGEKGHIRVAQAYSLSAQQEQFDALYADLLQHVSRSTIRIEAIRPAVLATRQEARPMVSVVVPVRNEELHIGSLLSQIERQNYPHDSIEVMVADGNSGDRTREIVSEFASRSRMKIRLLPNSAGLSSCGRNVGVRSSRGEYIVFIDGHCRIPTEHFLGDMVSLFEKTGADCLCRPQPLKSEENNQFQRVVADVRATVLGHGRDSTIYDLQKEGEVNPSSSGAMYRRSVFDSVGYYDEDFDACEDVEFNFRVFKAGLRSYLSPKLAVNYVPRRNARSLWQQMLRYGRGRFHLIQKHSDAFSLSQIIPSIFSAWIVAGGAASLVSRPFANFYLSTLAVYVAVVLAFSFWLGFRRGWRDLLLSPLVYVLIHLGLGFGFLGQVLRAATKLGSQRSSDRAARALPRRHQSLAATGKHGGDLVPRNENAVRNPDNFATFSSAGDRSD